MASGYVLSKDTPYEPSMKNPRIVKGMTLISPAEGKSAYIIGEAHPTKKEKKYTDKTVRFLHNQLALDKNRKLYIEASPTTTFNEPELNPPVRGTIGAAAQRLKVMHKDRIVPMDLRRTEGSPRANRNMSASEIERVADEIKKIISPLYSDFPLFQRVAEEDLKLTNLISKQHGEGQFHAPLLDAQILRVLKDMETQDDGSIPIFYVGDGHRKNVLKSLPENYHVVDFGLHKYDEDTSEEEGSGLAFNPLPIIEKKQKLYNVFEPNWNFY